MSESQVPDKLTPVHPEELYDALLGAWPTVIPEEPTHEALLVLLAHGAFELGWWHYCHCYNLGNAKHVTGDGRDYCVFRASEIIMGKEVFSDMAFRAFASLDEGAVDYLRLLHGEFSAAWSAVLAGNPAEFCHLLKVHGYYTAPEAIYTRGVVACFAQLLALLPPDQDTVIATSDPEAGGIPLPFDPNSLPPKEPTE